jgi:hypothetical protein
VRTTGTLSSTRRTFVPRRIATSQQGSPLDVRPATAVASGRMKGGSLDAAMVIGCHVSRGGNRLLPIHCRRLVRSIVAVYAASRHEDRQTDDALTL